MRQTLGYPLTRRRLDVELVRRGLVESRTAAALAIEQGRVKVAGAATPRAATLVDSGTGVSIGQGGPKYVSRGGLKLERALDQFEVAVEGRRAIDVGASTGGFTDCLLQRGAASVVALDVGYGQLDWKVRADARVTVIERTNIRHADAGRLGAPFDLVVADLSFISLRTVASALVVLGVESTDYILLVKPQFEAGRSAVGKGGIVREDGARLRAVSDTIAGLAEAGLGAVAVEPSPILGARGNREILGFFRLGVATVDPAKVKEAASMNEAAS